MILDEIVANKKMEITVAKQAVTPEQVKRRAEKQPPPRDFTGALTGTDLKLIAEVKKASPSKGIIRQDFDPVAIARIYERNGASAVSVLTDAKYFQGRLEYLSAIKQEVGIPVLRKDFILEPYQVYESRASGADAILLIVAILAPGKLGELLALSRALGMSCLVEVHNEKELDVALPSGARIIGINNRDLATMAVDIQTTERLRSRIPAGRLVVSESGIKDCSDMERLEKLKINAVLVGETLMASTDIGGKVKEILGKG